MAETKRLDHRDFGPLYNETSQVLILGSFPSVRSRQAKFYYGHPQNRFWKVLRALTDECAYKEALSGGSVSAPPSIPEKKALILENGFALWDTIESCVITGSSDSSIRDVKTNDMSVILKTAPIRVIGCNGAASHDLFLRYAMEPLERFCSENEKPLPQIVKLPSTSPANAAWSLARLTGAWSELLQISPVSSVGSVSPVSPLTRLP